MGQTRLLLLTLAVVIVGIAVMIGIRAFTDGNVSQNFDNLLRDAIRIAGDAQAWKTTPELMDGSPDDKKNEPLNFDGIDFLDMGYQPYGSTTCYLNRNGQFSLQTTEEGLLLIGASKAYQNRVVLVIQGTLEGDIDFDGTDSGEESVVRGGKLLYHDGTTTVGDPPGCTGSSA